MWNIFGFEKKILLIIFLYQTLDTKINSLFSDAINSNYNLIKNKFKWILQTILSNY